MTGDIRELLPLYALGMLESDEVRHVEQAVARDAKLAAELASYSDTANALGTVIVPVAPSPHVKDRLLASVGGGRFEQFASRIAALYDVSIAHARELLGLIDRPASWVMQIPGISLIDFELKERYATADCGFIKVAAGAVFPPHSHLGEETTILLSGRLHDVTNNRMIGPGDEYVQTQGTSHYLVCVGTEDAIYASRAINGIEVGGQRARPVKN